LLQLEALARDWVSTSFSSSLSSSLHCHNNNCRRRRRRRRKEAGMSLELHGTIIT
jgi:hypothetical protein